MSDGSGCAGSADPRIGFVTCQLELQLKFKIGMLLLSRQKLIARNGRMQKASYHSILHTEVTQVPLPIWKLSPSKAIPIIPMRPKNTNECASDNPEAPWKRCLSCDLLSTKDFDHGPLMTEKWQATVQQQKLSFCKPQNPAGSVSPKPVERLFPCPAGKDRRKEQTLKAIRKKIGFLLLTEDISPSRVHQIPNNSASRLSALHLRRFQNLFRLSTDQIDSGKVPSPVLF